jgi:uncharacterized protein YjcR
METTKKNNSSPKRLEKTQAIKMFTEGQTRKAIAQKIGVHPKTIANWVNGIVIKESVKKETLKNLQLRLLALSKDTQTPIEDINQLIICIKKLE